MAQGWLSDGGGLDEVVDETVVPKAWRAEDRLTSIELLTLLVAYRGGTSARVLAERYELGMTTVKRLVREYGMQREDRT